jgi:hypothetical protein
MELPARHARKGDCIIRGVASTSGRVKVFVDYPDLNLCGRPEFLDELTDRTTGRAISLQAPAPKVAPQTETSITRPSWQTARQTLLALRLGQSTFHSLKELSVGMEEIDIACKWALDRAASGQLTFLLFESPYGMGKSHALAQLKYHAMKREMAVGTVTLDGTSTSLCEPLSLISGLAHAIEFPDDHPEEGLPQRLTRRAGIGLNITGGELLHQLLKGLDRECAEDPDKWEYIEDYLSLDATATDIRRELGIKVPSLRTARRQERPLRCCTIMREWASACTVLGARNGLVLLLDEADVDYAQRSRAYDQEFRESLLREFRSMAEAPPGAGGFARLVIAMAITPKASTPDPVIGLKAELGSYLRVVRLRELTAGELRELGRRVSSIYRQGYEITGDDAKAETALNECLQITERQTDGRNPRKFIRLLLEKLDVLYA